MHSSLSENNKGERRERLPAQRSEACNSTGVLSRLASSGAMLVFIGGFVRVLSNPTSNRETPKMKKLYSQNLKLVSQIALPDLKHCDLAEFCVVFN